MTSRLQRFEDKPPLLHDYLSSFGELYDAALGMTKRPWKGPGYHSQVPADRLVHETRESLNYALALAIEGSTESVARAETILNRVLPLQDLDSTSVTFGLWPWLYEEPLSEMRPPDWNWADFCGACLAHLLAAYRDRLSAPTRIAMERGLRAAALSIFRRNVGPRYTNIAFKGGVVVAIAADYFSDDTLRSYALLRLTRFLAHLRENGGFTEYNSPIYSMVVLNEAERGLQLLQDHALRSLVHEVWYACWEEITDFLHLKTGQRAGPQSRTYADVMSRHFALVLGSRLGRPLFIPSDVPPPSFGVPAFLSTPRACPDDLREHLTRSSIDGRQERHPFIQADGSTPERVGTVWRSADLCLGSVNVDTFWTQRRPILGYWRVGDALAVLRVSVRHSKHDFCSGAVRTHQESDTLAVICSLAVGRGDFHDVLDRPEAGVFFVEDLHVAIQLEAPGASAVKRADDLYHLTAGGWSVWVQPVFAWMSDAVISWTIEENPGRAVIRATINGGAKLTLCPATLAEMAVGFGLSLRPRNTDLPLPEWAWSCNEAKVILQQQGPRGSAFSVTAPLAPATL